MQFTINEAKKEVKLRDIAVSVPRSICSSKIFSQESLIDTCCIQDCSSNVIINQMWTHQHPLILTWLVFSLLAIGFLFPLLFIIH